MMKLGSGRWIALGACVALLAGCAGAPRRAEVTYHDPAMDFSLLQNVAVLPFANMTPNPDAGGRVRDVFITMLQATGALYVIPPGEVGRGVSRSNMSDPTTPSSEDVVAFAKIVGADGVVTGSVLEYGEVRSGSSSANLISVSVRLLEAETGRVVWSASSTRGGISAADRLFGGGGEPMGPITADAVKELIDRLFGG